MLKRHHDKDPKFKFCNHSRILKYENIFSKGFPSNWLEEIFKKLRINKKLKNTLPWTYAIEGLNAGENAGVFYER